MVWVFSGLFFSLTKKKYIDIQRDTEHCLGLIRVLVPTTTTKEMKWCKGRKMVPKEITMIILKNPRKNILQYVLWLEPINFFLISLFSFLVHVHHRCPRSTETQCQITQAANSVGTIHNHAKFPFHYFSNMH